MIDVLEYFKQSYTALAPERKIELIHKFHRDDLVKLFSWFGFHVGVEIGTYKGEFAANICTFNPKIHLHCVDPWQAYGQQRVVFTQERMDACYEQAQLLLSKKNCTVHRMTSSEAVKLFANRSLDFVYIDGNHAFEYVVQDIALWSEKVKIGGLIAGHDYARLRNAVCDSHVVEAVNGYCNAYNIRPLFLTAGRTDKSRRLSKADIWRTWFFINQDKTCASRF